MASTWHVETGSAGTWHVGGGKIRYVSCRDGKCRYEAHRDANAGTWLSETGKCCLCCVRTADAGA